MTLDAAPPRAPRSGWWMLLLLPALMAGVHGVWEWHREQQTLRRWEVTTAAHLLDRLFPSMTGPGELQNDLTLGPPQDGLYWLTGYQAIMLDEQAEQRVGQQFMCHNSLFLQTPVSDYRQRLGTRPYGSPRLFTLAQGATRLDFPEGFAMPLPASQTLQLQSQSLNLLPEHVGQTVRHRIRLDFRADSEVAHRPRPLFMVEATGRILVRGPASPLATNGQPAAGRMRTDAQGRVWSGHWMVPPGQNRNRTRVTQELRLPFDTTVHFATAHLHPYAVSITLIDATEQREVLTIRPRWSEDGRSLAEVPAYSSVAGFPLHAAHDYELVTDYHNTSDQPITAMSILFLYCHDREFDVQTALQASSSTPSAPSTPTSVPEDFCGEDLPTP